ncbi:Glycogenin-2 [Chytriomyces hyalinus]|nr:Glycogenin-2 [Chytriomyces hyalinus]
MTYAYVTLVTNDAYAAGALVLAHRLRNTYGTQHEIVALIPPSQLSQDTVAQLYRVFDRVVYVGLLRSGHAPGDAHNLALLGRSELDVTYTKLHVFDPNVIGAHITRIVFLDADTLPLRPIDGLFSVLDGVSSDGIDYPGPVFAAAPDIGWPDIFNSGVFVAKPNKEIFNALCWDAQYSGSFDGGDQGILNSFFHTWAGHLSSSLDVTRQNIQAPVPRPTVSAANLRTARLPFSFNVTPSAVYSYLPAFTRFRSDINILHFAGYSKPWDQQRFSDGSVWKTGESSDTISFYDLWWTAYDELKAKWKQEDAEAETRKVESARKMQESRTSTPTRSSTPKQKDTIHYSWDRLEFPTASPTPPPVIGTLQVQFIISTSHTPANVNTPTSKKPSRPKSPLKIFDMKSDMESKQFQDPRKMAPKSSASPVSPATPTGNHRSGTDGHGPAPPSLAHVQVEQLIEGTYVSESMSSRYSWDPTEFSVEQRRRSQFNLPVMVPLAKTSAVPTSSDAIGIRQKSSDSLVDEEGVSLHPVRK